MANAFKTLKYAALTLLSGVAALLAAGCGGGGGGSALGGLNLFISDDLSTGYDQIWVSIHQIELQDSNGGFTTVFSSTDGVQVDLTNLSDGAPKFLYLGRDSIAAGNYTGVRVTMARDLTLVPTGSGTGDACTFDPAFDFGARSRVAFNFGAPLALAANDDFVVDFDLPNWTRAGNLVSPAIRQGDDSTIGNMARHEDEDFSGTVSGLTGTAPDQTFVLSRTDGSFNVATDANTVVFNEDGAGAPALANGLPVEVRGVFDTTSNSLLARSIKIDDGTADGDEIEGPTSNLDTNALTVDVEVHEADGFIPQDPIVHVQFSQTTQFFTKAGAPLTLAEMLDFLGTGIRIEAEGTYDGGSNTLTAAKMKLHPEDGEDHEAEAKGATSNINAGAGTFDLTLASWYGFSATNGQVIQVVTNGSTQFLDDTGNPITANDFFTGIQAGAWAEVEGVYDSGTLTAQKAKLEDNGAPGQPEAKGYVATWDAGAGTVTINLIEWFGFDGGPGQPQVIQTTGSTAFEDHTGNPLTQAQFFAGLSAGMVIDAKGSYAVGVLTATRARYKD